MTKTNETEQYIPGARDTIVGFYGASKATGGLRCYCCACASKFEIADDRPIRGGYCEDEFADGDRCDLCKVSFWSLSERAQAEHDAQQERWRKAGAVRYVIEMGEVSGVRCRVY